MFRTCLLPAFFVLVSAFAPALADDTITIEAPKVVLKSIPFDVTVTGEGRDGDLTLMAGETQWALIPQDGKLLSKGVTLSQSDILEVINARGEPLAAKQIRTLPGWLSLLPSFLAIAMALAFRQVLPALFVGLWSGAVLTYGFELEGLWLGFFDAIGIYVVRALVDSGHMSIIIFSLLIGGLVGIVSKNGGMLGIVQMIAKFAHTARRGQLSTAILGTVIFFDDYANTMVVGNTMRAVTDRLRISREKLAYIVDSTAAPIASLAIITTWIGFQVGLIDQSLGSMPGIEETAYTIFLKSIPFAFYSLFAIGFVYLIAASGRDFGPMAKAEANVRQEEADPVDFEFVTEEGMPEPQARYAVIPLLVLIIGTFIGILVTGRDGSQSTQSLQDIVGNGDPYLAMIWASSFAVLIAVAMTVLGRRLSLGLTMEAFVEGMKALLFAIVVLTLAWSLAGVNETLNTSGFLSAALADTLSPAYLPLIVFLLSALMAFATGSSWGVMGIVVPLIVPLTWAVISQSADGSAVPMYVLYSSVAAVLSGAVWGDHCSPISDTTILSSMASGCDHIEHVRTQLPYALVVALIAVLVGVLPSGFGLPPWISLVIGLALMIAVLFIIGRPSTDQLEQR